jgi:hypothetical protein
MEKLTSSIDFIDGDLSRSGVAERRATSAARTTLRKEWDARVELVAASAPNQRASLRRRIK